MVFNYCKVIILKLPPPAHNGKRSNLNYFTVPTLSKYVLEITETSLKLIGVTLLTYKGFFILESYFNV